jgi:CheY-like chemotaxis protein
MGESSKLSTDPRHAVVRPVWQKFAARWLISRFRVGLAGLAVGLWCAAPGQSVSNGSSELEASQAAGDKIELDRIRLQAKETQELYRLRVALPNAGAAIVPAVGPVRTPSYPLAPIAQGLERYVWWTLLLGVAGLLILRQIAPEIADAICSRLFPWFPSLSSAAVSREELAEQKAFEDFLIAFKAGPVPTRQTPPPEGASAAAPEPAEGTVGLLETEVDVIADFVSRAPIHLMAARNLLQEIGRGSGEASRQKLLGDLCSEVRGLMGLSNSPELLPAWQIASSLESLLKQLVAQPSKVTASTLRTVAAAVDVLDGLREPGLGADFCTNPAPRFLAVDDDALSRRAVSFSLQKAFSQPDVAENGEAALALAATRAYDAIFLDVLMPGMDGFELCSQIHQTEYNRTTPVVFVTGHNDFEAHSKASLCGGSDVLGKPFLSFEVTLKALTLTMCARLQARVVAAMAGDEINGPDPGPSAGGEREALVSKA